MNYLYTILKLHFENDDFNFYRTVLLVCFFGFTGIVSIILSPFEINLYYTYIISTSSSIFLPFIFGVIFGYKHKNLKYSKSKIYFQYVTIIIFSIILFFLGLFFKIIIFQSY
jgi:hypothetical protein